MYIQLLYLFHFCYYFFSFFNIISYLLRVPCSHRRTRAIGLRGLLSPLECYQIAIFGPKIRQYLGKTTWFSCKQWTKNIWARDLQPRERNSPRTPMPLSRYLWDISFPRYFLIVNCSLPFSSHHRCGSIKRRLETSKSKHVLSQRLGHSNERHLPPSPPWRLPPHFPHPPPNPLNLLLPESYVWPPLIRGVAHRRRREWADLWSRSWQPVLHTRMLREGALRPLDPRQGEPRQRPRGHRCWWSLDQAQGDAFSLLRRGRVALQRQSPAVGCFHRRHDKDEGMWGWYPDKHGRLFRKGDEKQPIFAAKCVTITWSAHSWRHQMFGQSFRILWRNVCVQVESLGHSICTQRTHWNVL